MLQSMSAKWKVFIARSIYLVMGFAEQRSFGEMLPVYVITFHTSVTLAGWSLTMITGLSYLLAPLIRILIEQTSLRFVAIIGGSTYGASFIILGLFGQNIWHVFLLHTAVGFSSASVNLATYLALGEHFDKKFGLANSGAFLVAALIGIVFPLLLLYLVVDYSLRWTLMIYGAISWNLIAGGIWVTSKTDHNKAIDNSSNGMLSTNQNPQPPFLLRSHPAIILLFALYSVTYTVSVGFSLTFYPYGLEKGLDINSAALLISWYSIGSLCGRLYVFLTFKWNLETHKAVVVAPIVLELTMQSASIISSNAILVGLGAFFAGFATGGMVTWGSSIVREVSCESHFRSAAAWLTSFGGIGATFAGLFAGWIHDIRGSYQHVMLFYIGLNFTQLVLALTVMVFSRQEDCDVSPVSDHHISESESSDGFQYIEMEQVCADSWEHSSQKDDEEELYSYSS